MTKPIVTWRLRLRHAGVSVWFIRDRRTGAALCTVAPIDERELCERLGLER